MPLPATLKASPTASALEKLNLTEPIRRIPPKNPRLIRYLSFNVNGAKTIFNYYPWTLCGGDLNSVFLLLMGDIVSLQELKLTPSNLSLIRNIGHLPNYRSFISLPPKKKGYSGVGLFVRIPQPGEDPQVIRHLSVIKAEDGLTGCNPANANDTQSPAYRDCPNSIGGYDMSIDKEAGLDIDSQGRCVVVELACNTVIFSVYCPANSMATEEGESRRLAFLSALFNRARTLKSEMGKQVIILGDINVCCDLIDSAEYMANLAKINSTITAGSDGLRYETLNHKECVEFQQALVPRQILHASVYSGLQCKLSPERAAGANESRQFLYDTTRYHLGRQMNIYSVWNTLTNARATNFGSRIDLILASSSRLVQSISAVGVLPHILGLDHCPVYTDFDVTDLREEPTLPTKTRILFEAKIRYKLMPMRDISQMFAGIPKEKPPSTRALAEPVAVPSQKLTYTSRKPNREKKQGIDAFFTNKRARTE